jgi:hypothetical protein
VEFSSDIEGHELERYLKYDTNPCTSLHGLAGARQRQLTTTINADSVESRAPTATTLQHSSLVLLGPHKQTRSRRNDSAAFNPGNYTLVEDIVARRYEKK